MALFFMSAFLRTSIITRSFLSLPSVHFSPLTTNVLSGINLKESKKKKSTLDKHIFSGNLQQHACFPITLYPLLRKPVCIDSIPIFESVQPFTLCFKFNIESLLKILLFHYWSTNRYVRDLRLSISVKPSGCLNSWLPWAAFERNFFSRPAFEWKLFSRAVHTLY